MQGREAELASLTAAVRRLIALTVTTAAPPAETEAAAAALNTVADRLALHVPEPLPYLYVTAASDPSDPDAAAPFDVIHGPYNPLALPVRIEIDAPKALGYARFTKPYEGPPGCVHGAVLCSVFDMVFTAANRLANAAGPTIELGVRYRHPTRLGVDTTFEGWVSARAGRITTTEGRVLQDGVVTVEASGRFVRLSREQVLRLGESG